MTIRVIVQVNCLLVDPSQCLHYPYQLLTGSSVHSCNTIYLSWLSIKCRKQSHNRMGRPIVIRSARSLFKTNGSTHSLVDPINAWVDLLANRSKRRMDRNRSPSGGRAPTSRLYTSNFNTLEASLPFDKTDRRQTSDLRFLDWSRRQNRPSRCIPF